MFSSSCNWTFMFILVLVVIATHGYAHHTGFSDISKDLPQKGDLSVYLESLQRIVQFCSENKYELDLNFEFGLFLTNVNIKSVLANKKSRIPKLLRMYVKLLLRKNDELIHYFHNMVRGNHDSQNNGQKMIISLFTNEALWMTKIPDFNMIPLLNVNVSLVKPSSWVEYVKNVDDMDNSVPNPKLSDMCMISLASNKVYGSERSRCHIYQPCYNMLVNGTDCGYALTHRLLFLLNARYSRGCSVFSSEHDREMIKNMCAMMYAEAEYIAQHSYGIVDLLLEQMILCSLDGHAQFLQRKWLSNILRFQTEDGCFGQTPAQPGSAKKAQSFRPAKTWKMAKHRDHMIMDGLCNGHVTSVAAATLSAAIKYILEVHY